MRKFLQLFALAILTIGFTAGTQANEYEASARSLVNGRIKAWLGNPEIINAVKAQNEKHADLGQAEIDALDQKWLEDDDELIKKVLNNDLSTYLQGVKESGQGLYTEIFVMDDKGLNVGQSDKTSDYWQGDEAKWKETYLVGPDAIHVSDIEEDESTQTFQVQISLPLVDNGIVIGAVTVGINAEMLE